MWKLETLKKEIERLDPKLKRGTSAFKSAVILFSATQVGPDMEAIVKYSKLPRAFVEERFERLEKNHVFYRGKIRCEWFKKKAGTISFWLDVNIAEGYMERAKA